MTDKKLENSARQRDRQRAWGKRLWSERMGILVAQTTKRALEASLKKLLLRKPLNKITISDITEDCGVNRMTFYYHFKDIYDLVDWILMEDAAEALEGLQDFETWSGAPGRCWKRCRPTGCWC